MQFISSLFGLGGGTVAFEPSAARPAEILPFTQYYTAHFKGNKVSSVPFQPSEARPALVVPFSQYYASNFKGKRPLNSMRAWRVHAYGAEGNPADTIAKMTLDTIPIPEPGSGQVLIKVEMAAINPIDWKLFSGSMHGMIQMSFPYVPGFDAAGIVTKLGPDVSNLAVGDKVVVDIGLESVAPKGSPPLSGAFAEYAIAIASTVSKREALEVREVVGLPLAGMTSYQALLTGKGESMGGSELGSLESGQKVLVLGGAAATGCLAIQIAKSVGAYVATTASDNKMPDGSSKLDYMKQLGADEVINYRTADWSEVLAGKDFDLIYDCVGDAADWPKASKILKKKATFVSIANFGANSSVDYKFKNFLVKSNAEDLDKLLTLVRDKKLTVPVDVVMPFDKVPEALTKSLGWSSAGKICIQG